MYSFLKVGEDPHCTDEETEAQKDTGNQEVAAPFSDSEAAGPPSQRSLQDTEQQGLDPSLCL